jgi:hypothetical protein
MELMLDTSIGKQTWTNIIGQNEENRIESPW